MKTVVSGQWSVVSGQGPRPVEAQPRPRRGITLTEILISIMILGIGLVSLATLFPIGLLRLRDATRYTRSAILLQTAASDAVSRGLFSSQSFQYAEGLNYEFSNFGLTPWYPSAVLAGQGAMPPSYSPLTQDTAFYGDDPFDQNNPGVTATRLGPGLPFAYDPLWRYQAISTAKGTQGYYMGDTFEARFGYGLTTIRSPDSDGGVPSAHGLQRITNFNRPFVSSAGGLVPVMPASLYVPSIFVSQEDVLWQDPKTNANTYTMEGTNGGTPVAGPSPVIPDLNTSGGSVTLDWRYSWMFTGQLTSASNLSCFDGNIVIFENRSFGIKAVTLPFTPQAPYASQHYQVDGETVVEAIFGFSANVVSAIGGAGYGSAADRTVLLRWPAGMPDPVVRPGDWIADVTYERHAAFVASRFLSWPQASGNNNGGLQNIANNGEWDNLPAQRCYWYQVQKVGTPAPDPNVITSPHRSMVVFVNQNLISRTVLTAGGQPAFMNAALIAPNVVNVIPQTIFLR